MSVQLTGDPYKDVERLVAEIAALRAERDRYRNALVMIAEPFDPPVGPHMTSEVKHLMGIATRALTESKESWT